MAELLYPWNEVQVSPRHCGVRHGTPTLHCLCGIWLLVDALGLAHGPAQYYGRKDQHGKSWFVVCEQFKFE